MPKMIPEEQILEAAIKLISERSYQGASTRHIAEAAGISEITLFRKYGTKAEVTRRALLHLLKNDRIKSAFEYTGDLRSDFIRIVDVYQDVLSRYGHFMGVLIMEASRTPEIKGIMEVQSLLVKNFTRLIKKYQEEQRLFPEPPGTTISALLGPLMYEGMLQNLRQERTAPSTDSAAYVDRFLDGRKISGDFHRPPDEA